MARKCYIIEKKFFNSFRNNGQQIRSLKRKENFCFLTTNFKDTSFLIVENFRSRKGATMKTIKKKNFDNFDELIFVVDFNQGICFPMGGKTGGMFPSFLKRSEYDNFNGTKEIRFLCVYGDNGYQSNQPSKTNLENFERVLNNSKEIKYSIRKEFYDFEEPKLVHFKDPEFKYFSSLKLERRLKTTTDPANHFGKLVFAFIFILLVLVLLFISFSDFSTLSIKLRSLIIPKDEKEQDQEPIAFKQEMIDSITNTLLFNMQSEFEDLKTVLKKEVKELKIEVKEIKKEQERKEKEEKGKFEIIVNSVDVLQKKLIDYFKKDRENNQKIKTEIRNLHTLLNQLKTNQKTVLNSVKKIPSIKDSLKETNKKIKKVEDSVAKLPKKLSFSIFGK